jgi:hypothetical protein
MHDEPTRAAVPPPASSRRGARGVLAALAALLAVLAWGCGGGDDFPELEPFPPELDERMVEIRELAAETRGLAPNEGIEQGTLSPQRYERYIRDNIGEIDEELRRELEAYNTAYRLLHLIGDDEDLLESVTEVSAVGFLGLYFFEEDRLVLIDDDDTISMSEEMTLAHEYVHSFQDAAFDLDGWDELVEAEEADGAPLTQYGLTLGCLFEGDASLAEEHYAEARWGTDWPTLVAEDGASGSDEGASFDEVSPALLRYFAFDYVQCPEFVAALYERGGWDAINRAYADPPATVEQVLHVEKYEAREPAAELPRIDLTERLGASWERLTVDAFGEFDAYNHLLSITEDYWGAVDAAAGWGAGWLAVYRDTSAGADTDQSVVVHISTEWDTAVDLREYAFQLGVVINVVSEGEFELLTEDGPARWQGDGEWGYVSWDERAKRVDLLVATAPEALDLARTAVLTHAITVDDEAGSGGLAARALRLDDLGDGVAVVREEHVRAAGTVAAFERAFEPAGGAASIDLGGSTALTVESHVAAYVSASEAVLALSDARQGLSDREAEELLTRLLGVNVGPNSYRQVVLDPGRDEVASGRLIVGAYRLDVTWVRAQHEETVGTLVVMSASEALDAQDVTALAETMVARLAASGGAVDLESLRPAPLFDDEEAPAGSAEFVAELVDAVFRQQSWGALVEWSAPELNAEPGYEQTLAEAAALSGPLAGAYVIEDSATIALQLEGAAEPVPAVQYVLFGEFELGEALLELIVVEQAGELRLAGWFLQPLW